MVERALRLGATTLLLQQFFGLSPQDVALQRLMMGVTRAADVSAEQRTDRCRLHLVQMDMLMAYQSIKADSIAMLDDAGCRRNEIAAQRGCW